MLLRIIRANPYGWVVVAVLFLVMSVVMTGRSSIGLLMPTWQAELGWDRTFISTGGAVMLIVMALGAPVAGLLLDRFGSRNVYVIALAIVAAAVAVTSTMTETWQFLVLFGVLGGIGFSCISAPLIATTVALYFTEDRGFATGIASSGATGGQLILMPLLAVGVTEIGWRPSFVVLAVLVAVAGGVTWLLIRREARPKAAPGARKETLGERLRLIAGDRTFWLLGFGYVVCGFTTVGSIRIHFLPYAATCGFPPVESATAFGVLATFSMMGMIGYGALADRYHRPLLLASIYFLRSFCFLLLMHIAGDTPLLFIFAAVFGIFDFSTFPVVANIVSTHMSLRIMGLTMGLLFALHSVGGALGSFVGGWLFDVFAQYDWVWIVSFALALAAAFASILIPEHRGRGMLREPAAAVG